MNKLALIFVALVAALQFYIAWFEIFAWTTVGPTTFTTLAPDLFDQTVPMAANQGLYNAFLAIGLVWALLIKDAKWQSNIAICFLGFVAVAGIFAAATIAVKPGMIQTIPAGIGLVLLFLSSTRQRRIAPS